jgi:hypothetical protein
MTVDSSKYRLIWDFKNGKIPLGESPKTISALRSYYERRGYTVKTEGKKLYIKKG